MATRRRGSETIPFWQILSTLMEERGLSLQQIADLAGVGKSVAHGWVNGTVPHDLPAVSRLAKALGISFKSLLLGEPEEHLSVQTMAELYEETPFFEWSMSYLHNGWDPFGPGCRHPKARCILH